MIREKVKELWKLCFNDNEDFIELYFEKRYNNNVNIAIQSGKEVIAALQMLPYPMTFAAKKINTVYISGACTHPDFRGRGVMHQLLSQAFTKMLHNNVAVSTLIPAEPWLFDYYTRTGYATVFHCSNNIFTASATSPLQENDLLLNRTDEYAEDIYKYLDSKLAELPCCIQHTENDFRVILSDLQLNQGSVFTLNSAEGIVALAVSYPEEGGNWRIGEIVSDAPSISSLLLQRICEELNIPSISVRTPSIVKQHSQPFGMARIINAKIILSLYAVTHPEVEINIALTDEQIDINNGYYYLNNGKCMSSRKRLPGSHLSFTIRELTEKIFADMHPHISLMMD